MRVLRRILIAVGMTVGSFGLIGPTMAANAATVHHPPVARPGVVEWD